MKDKLKSLQRLSQIESILFEYHKLHNDDDYNIYIRETYDLQPVNILYDAQIRYVEKAIIYQYFDYCDKNIIEIFYCNTDSILIKEKSLDKMTSFISKKYGYFNIEGRLIRGTFLSLKVNFV
jgi:hypothetical protein